MHREDGSSAAGAALPGKTGLERVDHRQLFDALAILQVLAVEGRAASVEGRCDDEGARSGRPSRIACAQTSSATLTARTAP